MENRDTYAGTSSFEISFITVHGIFHLKPLSHKTNLNRTANYRKYTKSQLAMATLDVRLHSALEVSSDPINP